MTLKAGARLGSYEVVALVGAGGMGEVYRARDTRLNRDVALKVLPDALAQDADYMARFQREAQVLASLNHPNIAMIYGIEQNAIVMELVPGATLEQRLAEGRLHLEEAVTLARQIAEALEAAHEKGIVHRDLKPANVKVTPEGVVKVLDFGLAKSIEPASPASSNMSPTLTIRSTQAGVIMGTAAYMSPEQASGKGVDKRADVWSFGVVLYEMLTGEHLFDGETVSHTLADVLRAPIDLGRLLAGTPPAIRLLLERCLDRQARDRLRDIGEARIVLQRALAEPAGPAPAPVIVRPARLPWILAALATLAAVGFGYAAFRHFREEPPSPMRLSLPLSSNLHLTLDGFGAPNIALSPDGKHVAYLVTTDGHQALWVRDLDTPAARILTNTEDGSAPFWSPDSRFIGFSERRSLKKVPLTGGPPTVICECSGNFGATWSRQDIILFAPSGSEILKVPSSGGTPSPVTKLDRSRGEDSHRYPWFLPDGRHFLYTARLGDRVRSAVYAGDLDSEKHLPVVASATNAAYATGHLIYAQNRTLMAQPFDAERLRTTGEAVPLAQGISYYANSTLAGFSISQTGNLLYSSSDVRTSQLTWFDRTGKVTGTISTPGDMEFVSLSPNGKTVAFTRNDAQSGNPDLWLHDLERNTDSRFTFSGSSRFPLWSADGKTIFFTGARGGARKLFQKAANGTGPESVVHEEGFIANSASRDGSRLVLTTSSQTPKTGNDIWVLQLSGGKALPYIATEFAEFFPTVSPDGRWLAYMSDESKRSEIYVTGFPERSGKWQVSTDGGSRTAWSDDGKELYFISSGGMMMAAAVAPGPEFKAGVPKPLFPVRMPQGNTNFVVSKDGRFLVPSLVDQSSQTLNLILHWPSLLRRE